jgi:hypothetical protein
MLGLITLALALGVSWFGYGAARRFVRDRLRYVETALTPGAAVIAGIGAAVLFSPFAYLPLITGGTVLAFGLGVGLGARAGASDVKRGYRITDGT